MLKIRLQRVGRKHEPSFRLVLTDSQNSAKSGRFKEVLGSYDPRKTGESINAERVKHWISMGAHPTDTVHNLLVTHKVIEGKKKNVLPKKTFTPAPVEEAAPEAAPAAEAVEAPVEIPNQSADADATGQAPASSDIIDGSDQQNG